MYSIAEGTVHMLSPNEKKVIAVLHTGAFFGELGVYTTTKRLTSFIAASFCLIYILDKEALRDILKSFPYACSEFERYCKLNLCYKSEYFLQLNKDFHLEVTCPEKIDSIKPIPSSKD